ncbi:unnamed protein product [Vitrella brassicaformis CCMP3155]|uniref:MHD domain-containing protein n=1 Tax=Vitrella brassicaformis (strain CCMP3155) TaxID=1169540 RepID=A0A0G4GI18_VITBC|nr:unnamed protein product [Vitrella brassicaformis CCMP3155]|eukprot:CEM29401.1 unnamed protein product [Vitrella brassicaformis CCMP3155]
MDALFILNDAGSFIVEKHFRGRIGRAVCDPFLDLLQTHAERGWRAGDAIPAVFSHDRRHTLFHIRKHRLFYLGVTRVDVSPLTMLELLERIHSVLVTYFGEVTEDTLRSHFSTLYLVLDEMVDSGLPAITEPNLLEMLISPPSVLNKVVQVVSGSSKVLSELAWGSSGTNQPPQANMGEPAGPFGSGGGITGCGSDIWWRRADVVYAGNEVYVDINETMDCIIDSHGQTVAASIAGEVVVNSKLSGLPDLTLTVKNPSLLDNSSFHPCVRLHRYERDKVLSFVPPDGEFTVCRYWLSDPTLQPPINLQPSLTLMQTSGRLELRVGPKLSVGMVGGTGGGTAHTQAVLEKVSITIPMPEFVSGATLTATAGTIKYKSDTRAIVWSIPKLSSDQQPPSHYAEGTLTYDGAKEGSYGRVAPQELKCVADVSFLVKGWAISGVKLDTLEVSSVSYQPYKGCRYSTQAGHIEYRL